MQINKQKILLVLWLIIFYNNAIAGDKKKSVEDLLELSLEELMQVEIRTVTIASGIEQTVARAPAVTSVITAEDIEAMGVTDLDEVLETIPGLHVGRVNIGYNPIYAIRGIQSNFNPEVLLMINGVPLNNLFVGNRSQIWGGMPINNIARIEIIRGPGSALFGADAFSGVINVMTKGSQDIDGTEVGLRMGSFNTKETWLLHGGEWKDFDIAVSLEQQVTDGQKEIIDVDYQSTLDKAFGTDVSLAPGPLSLSRRNFDGRLDISYQNWQLRTGYQIRDDFGDGAGAAQALDSHGRMAEDRINADLIYHNAEFAEDWDVTAQMSYLSTASETIEDVILFPPGAFGGAYPDGFIGNTGVSERHTRFELSSLYTGFEKHLVRSGIGYHYGDLYEVLHAGNYGINPSTGLAITPDEGIVDASDTPYAFLPEGDRTNYFAFLQDTWNFAEEWQLMAGIRYDKYSDFGSTINPRLALVWQIDERLATKLLYGSAFRAPAFQELYNINNPVTLGNRALQPETIKTTELAFDYRFEDNLHLALNIFFYKLSDAIRFLPGATGDTFTAQNAGSQSGKGFEFETQWKITPTFGLVGNYAFQKSIDDAHNQDVGNAPHHQVYLRADWQFQPNWSLNTQVNWIADRERVYGDPREPIDDYATVDLNLRYKDFKEHWDFAFVVRNAFDADAREPSSGPDTSNIIGIPNDLPLAGRNYFLELRYHF